MTVIAHNITAMNTQRQYGINTDLKAKTAEKLASGYRINRAADDAAGLAISEKMRSQIRGLTKGVQNTEEGVSLCHVADGALNEVSAMLHRMKELSVQSANGTNTDEDRENLQDEVSQLLEEIDRISQDTEFNTIPIFQGQTERTVIPAVHAELTAKDFTVTGVPTDTVSTQYLISADDTGFKINNDVFSWADLADSAGNDLSKAPIVAGTYSMAYHGMNISVNVENNAKMDDIIGILNGAKFSTTVDSQYIPSVVTVTSASGQRQMVGVASDVTKDAFTLSIKDDKFSIVSACITGNDGYLGSVSDTPFRGMSEIPAGEYKLSFDYGLGAVVNKLELNISTSVAMSKDELFSLLNDGELEHYSLQGMEANVAHYDTSATFRSDDLEAAGFSYGEDVILNYIKVDGKEGYQIGTNGPILYKTLDLAPSWTDGNFNPGKMEFSDGRGNTIRLYRESYVVSSPGQTIKFNHKSTGWEYFTGIDIKDKGTTLVDASVGAVNDADYKGELIAPEVIIHSVEDLSLWIQSGANEGQGMWLTIDNMSTTILGLADMDISTTDGATKALGQVREALAKVSKNRSKIGAQQNRLEHTIDRENVAIENLTASESGIRDADMASEMVNLSKYNILEQTGQAMMAQANQSKQGVLQLLSQS